MNIMKRNDNQKMSDREAYKFMRWAILTLSLVLAFSNIPH